MKRITAAALSFALVTEVAACSDSPAGIDHTSSGNSSIVVSNATALSASLHSADASHSLAASATSVAYVSAAPRTFPNVLSAVVRNQTRSNVAPLTVAVIEGGFDPIGIEAQADDELSVTILADGLTKVFYMKVPFRRPPEVVRTSPAKGRTDVALNVQLVAVFSEPVEGSSLTLSSIRLERDGNHVNGHVRLSADGLSAEFISDTPRQPQTAYSLVIDKGVRDLDGDELAEASLVTFTTSTTVSAGTIEISVSTSGSDLDADGYQGYATGQNSFRWVNLPANGRGTITGVAPGKFAVGIQFLARNCTIVGPPWQKVTVTAGETTSVTFEVRCVSTGSLSVRAVTTGVELDADGYHVIDASLRGDFAHWSTGIIATVPSNGIAGASHLPPGNYQILIESIAPNCKTAVPSPRNVTITAGVETSLDVQVNCDVPGQIAFVGGLGIEAENVQPNIANADIYVVKSNGTGTTRLTSSPGADLNPAWSPDGARIAFASDRAGNREIFVMNADGSNPVRLTNHPSADYLPAWSPDGTRIAFVSERDGNAEIYVMNADGSNPGRLTNNSAIDTEPAWSPDGSKIAFRRGRSNQSISDTWGGDIYVMNADGSDVTQLTFSTHTTSGVQPTWSPDGKQIAFLSNGIYTMNADGSESRRIKGFPYALHPDWSPDGQLIAFDYLDCGDIWGPACAREIVISTTAGSFSIEIYDATEPAWRPRR